MKTLLLATIALGWFDAAPQEPTEHLQPKYVKCDGELIELPGDVQLPISCEEARKYVPTRACPAYSKKCDDRINQIIRCYDKHFKNKKKRMACINK